MMSELRGAVCPGCTAALHMQGERIACQSCGQEFPRVAGIPVLLPKPEAHLELWKGQLALLLERGRTTLAALGEAAAKDALSPLTRQRLVKLGQAVQEQVSDLAALLEPALGGAAAAPASALPRGVVEYIGYLYRDWGWPSAGYVENERALEALGKLNEGRALGHTLVLGAGACGLAYDLHRLCGATQTVVLDVDPYLLVVAEKIVRGGRVRLTEASLKVMEVEEVSRAWLLEAAAGPLQPASFQFVFADGVEPPFVDGSFDSVVTPWFIDQVPRDLPVFFARLARLLRPGGRWLNQGPLVYPEQTPFAQRFSRDELFELAASAGFSIDGSSCASMPYLVSPLSGSGKVESVLSFAASRR
jgi:SAM-dependent methyltransferase